jgi:hypothetical protein
VGTYILSPFSAAAGATAAMELLGWFPRLKRFGGIVSALFGGPMATYTAVLLANTAVPSWRAPHKQLPFVFAGSALAAGGGLTMIFTPVAEAGPSRKMAVTGAAIELAVVHKVENEHGIVSEPYHEGRAGKFMKAAKACTAAGAGLTVVAGRTRLGAVASGTLLAARCSRGSGSSTRAWPAPGIRSTPWSRSASASPPVTRALPRLKVSPRPSARRDIGRAGRGQRS